MKYVGLVVFGLAAFSIQSLSAQQTRPDISTLAQALDRCMTTYAVRMTRTDASDETIFTAATNGCNQIETELTAAVRRDMPPAQAEAAIQQLGTQARPNFISLLQRIRADRAARGNQ